MTPDHDGSSSSALMPFTPVAIADNLGRVLAKATADTPEGESRRRDLMAALDDVFLGVHLQLLGQDVTENYEERLVDGATSWINEATELVRRTGLPK